MTFTTSLRSFAILILFVNGAFGQFAPMFECPRRKCGCEPPLRTIYKKIPNSDCETCEFVEDLQPVLGCKTSCVGVYMSNGKSACDYREGYCGDQYIATNLHGEQFPSCFPLDSNMLAEYGVRGCDLSQCPDNRQPVLGCKTSCVGIYMSNGKPACDYREGYCGAQYIETNIHDKQFP